MKSKIKLLICIQLLFFIISCATSQQGTEQVVRFTSIPSGAKLLRLVMVFLVLLLLVKLNYLEISHLKLQFQKPGFTTESVRVNSVSQWSRCSRSSRKCINWWCNCHWI
ncbi:MAG: hypothetical protein CM15mP106_0430 [Candidatus Neomarinimicrobiota bacterium]|nr:MAG: hypothetical protein CM15mP106_0430 [Candidatus Neomarinimicrobiota bacterium]